MTASPASVGTLPILEHEREIIDALSRSQVVIVSGDTGSGKTTQLPRICLHAGRGMHGRIGITQPRRLACTAMARRVAAEFGEEVGGRVGYVHRFDRRLSRQTQIEFMTDGVLLASTRADPTFSAFDTLIIDEAHERSLNIDFLLGLLVRALPRRPDLKVIVSSATMDTARFSEFFGGCPVVKVPGRLYPVEVRWRGDDEEDAVAELPRRVANAVDELICEGPGDILVFLPGERDIRECKETLTGRRLENVDILPLLASLPAAEQQRVFQTSSRRRVVLSTNVAETSVTIPGIRYVVDSGLARVKRHNPRTHVQRLQIEPISQASAEQRKGRCGRVAPGVCIRLYDEDDFEKRDAYTVPEIVRSPLSGVILTMLNLGLGDVERFPFIDPPSRAAVRDGLAELVALGAVKMADEKSAPQLTPSGRQLAQLPLDPSLGRALFAAASEGVLPAALILAASLSCDDPRRRPVDAREAADRAHARFLDATSDFLGILRLWNWYRAPTDATRSVSPWVDSEPPLPSSTTARKLCKANYLSFTKMREWCDLRDQLAEVLKGLGVKNVSRTFRDEAERSAALHRALLAGLVTNIGHRDPEKGDYRGTRSVRFALFPGSGLAKKKAERVEARARVQPGRREDRAAKQLGASREWVLAANLVDTSRLFARTAACIDPAWIEPVARPLCRYSYHTPTWDARSGFVRIRERVVLLGLVLVDGRLRDAAQHVPEQARELFIRQGLVECEFPAPVPPCLQENRRRIEELLAAEAKLRRSGSLYDPETAFRFYAQRLPVEVCSAPALRRWLATQPADALRLSAADLPPVRDLKREFPDEVEFGEHRFPVVYRHEPDGACDGVTCELAVDELSGLPLWRAEWLVPGMLDEKLRWMIGALPVRLRRLLQPLNETLPRLRGVLTFGEEPLEIAVARAIDREFGVRVGTDAWKGLEPPAHLQMRFELVAEDGSLLGAGRNLAGLLKLFAPEARVCATPAERQVRSSADLGERFAQRLGREWKLYLQPPRMGAGLTLHLRSLEYTPQRFADECAHAALREAFSTATPLAREAEFEARFAKGAEKLGTIWSEEVRLALGIFQLSEELEAALHAPGVMNETVEEIEEQLVWLLYPGFVAATSRARLREYPRYLEAIRVRLERARTNPGGDASKSRMVEPHWRRYVDFATQDPTPAHDARKLADYRWLCEEFRVQQFAQELRTAVPVSAKRLDALWLAAIHRDIAQTPRVAWERAVDEGRNNPSHEEVPRVVFSSNPHVNRGQR